MGKPEERMGRRRRRTTMTVQDALTLLGTDADSGEAVRRAAEQLRALGGRAVDTVLVGEGLARRARSRGRTVGDLVAAEREGWERLGLTREILSRPEVAEILRGKYDPARLRATDATERLKDLLP